MAGALKGTRRWMTWSGSSGFRPARTRTGRRGCRGAQTGFLAWLRLCGRKHIHERTYREDRPARARSAIARRRRQVVTG